MKKIPTLFQRNFTDGSRIDPILTPGTEWVQAGEGIATEKVDGTCCMIRDGFLFKRREIKKDQPLPVNFEPAGPEDPNTGKTQGWLPVTSAPEDKWHQEAWFRLTGLARLDGTYELIGPAVQGNPYNADHHFLMRHGSIMLPDVPRTYDGLNEFFAKNAIEGVVFHHPDGRMVKIKRRDFGFPWPDTVRPKNGWCRDCRRLEAGSTGGKCDECRYKDFHAILERMADDDGMAHPQELLDVLRGVEQGDVVTVAVSMGALPEHLRAAVEESWKRNEAGYRSLAEEGDRDGDE